MISVGLGLLFLRQRHILHGRMCVIRRLFNGNDSVTSAVLTEVCAVLSVSLVCAVLGSNKYRTLSAVDRDELDSRCQQTDNHLCLVRCRI